MQLLAQPERWNNRIKIRLVLLTWKIANLLVRTIQTALFRANKRPQKILVFRTGSIGDSICALPAISSLRAHFPHASLHLLTNAGKGRPNLVSIEALITPGIFNKIINYEGLSREALTIQLKAERYDLVIHLTPYNAPLTRLIRDMLFFRFWTDIKSGFGWQCAQILLFGQTQEKYIRYSDERERLQNILQQNGIPPHRPNLFPFRIGDADRQQVDRMVGNLQLSGRPILAVVAGAKRPQNRWPVGSFEQVIRHYTRDFDIFLIGGPDDLPVVEPLLNLPHTYSFCGLLTPVQSGLLMQRCVLVLSNDTGPMHIAYTFGVPVVAIFSNRDFPNKWYPPADGPHTVIRASDVACSICFSETCSNNVCMQKISPESVIRQVDTSLRQIIRSIPAD